MKEPRRIVKVWYQGDKDKDGLPHGEGRLEYLTDESDPPFPQYPDLADYYREVGRMIYKGHFWHGKRDGEGYLAELSLSPCSKYEWYSEGDYDCGRLVHPEHPAGSYREGVCMKEWRDVFNGTWRDDMPLKHKFGWVTPTENDLQLARHTSMAVLEKDFDFANLP